MPCLIFVISGVCRGQFLFIQVLFWFHGVAWVKFMAAIFRMNRYVMKFLHVHSNVLVPCFFCREILHDPSSFRRENFRIRKIRSSTFVMSLVGLLRVCLSSVDYGTNNTTFMMLKKSYFWSKQTSTHRQKSTKRKRKCTYTHLGTQKYT